MQTDPGSQELPSADSHQWDVCEFLNLMNWAVPRIEMNLEALNLEASQSRWILGHPQPHASHWEESSHDLQCGLTHRLETYWKRISFSFTVMRTHFTAKEKNLLYHLSLFSFSLVYQKCSFVISLIHFKTFEWHIPKWKLFLYYLSVWGLGRCSTPHTLVALLIIFWQACN